MKIKLKKKVYIPRDNWHPWFAWFPVEVSNDELRWLETVERKGQRHESYDDVWWSWEYKELEKSSE